MMAASGVHRYCHTTAGPSPAQPSTRQTFQNSCRSGMTHATQSDILYYMYCPSQMQPTNSKEDSPASSKKSTWHDRHVPCHARHLRPAKKPITRRSADCRLAHMSFDDTYIGPCQCEHVAYVGHRPWRLHRSLKSVTESRTKAQIKNSSWAHTVLAAAALAVADMQPTQHTLVTPAAAAAAVETVCARLSHRTHCAGQTQTVLLSLSHPNTIKSAQ
jgi:hypothetical protein